MNQKWHKILFYTLLIAVAVIAISSLTGCFYGGHGGGGWHHGGGWRR